jgi:spore germination protein YaaH
MKKKITSEPNISRVKYDSEGRPSALTEEDIADILRWEAIAKKTIEEAVNTLHAKGISSVHMDGSGIYEEDADGKKTRLGDG